MLLAVANVVESVITLARDLTNDVIIGSGKSSGGFHSV